MKGKGRRLAQSRFLLICYSILIGNERELGSAGSSPGRPLRQKYKILTTATSQKLDFRNISSVLYVFIFVAQCISQHITQILKIMPIYK